MRDNYYCNVRFFEDSPEVTRVHVYKVPSTRRVVPFSRTFAHEPWYDDNGVASGMFIGRHPFELGQQLVDKFGGASGRPRRAFVYLPGVVCGTAEQWGNPLRLDRPGDTSDGLCCFSARPIVLAELVQSAEGLPLYGWWELYCDPATQRMTRRPDGFHALADEPAEELGGKIGIKVPGSVVDVQAGCEAQPWVFRHDTLRGLVELSEETPSVVLPGGGFAYAAVELQPQLSGSGADPVATGLFIPGAQCYVVDLAGNSQQPPNAKYLATLIGQQGTVRVYAERLHAVVPAPAPGGGTVYSTSASDPPEFPTDPVENTTYIINVTSTGATYNLAYVVIDGVGTWIDLCGCGQVQWWCVDGDCVQSWEDPGGASGGPYATKGSCDSACAGLAPWWCVEEACVQSWPEPTGATGGPFGTESECTASPCPAPTGVETGCSANDIPETLRVRFLYDFLDPPCGDCLSSDVATMIYAGSSPDPTWTGEIGSGCPNPVSLVVKCVAGVWQLSATNICTNRPADFQQDDSPYAWWGLLDVTGATGEGMCNGYFYFENIP